MRLSRLLAVPLFTMLLPACSTHSVALAPRTDPRILEGCIDPKLVADPVKATDNDLATMMLELGQAYLDCKARDASKAEYIRRLAAK